MIILHTRNKNYDQMMYGWMMDVIMMYVMDVIIFHFGHFLPFYPPNNPKNQNFQKMKTTPRDIIILQVSTKNYDQMMYGF